MFSKIVAIINSFDALKITDERKAVLHPLIAYIKQKHQANETISLNFICTHNSRRSHLSQIWAQTMAYNFGIKNVHCYSGGTEATAMFPKVAETLTNQGFQIEIIAETNNPIYAVKYNENEAAIICFSKPYQHLFNPKSNFGAIMTCNNADQGCPIVLGAAARFPIKYNDPKAFDNTDIQTEKYAERSLEIAQEMWYVFSKIK